MGAVADFTMGSARAGSAAGVFSAAAAGAVASAAGRAGAGVLPCRSTTAGVGVAAGASATIAGAPELLVPGATTSEGSGAVSGAGAAIRAESTPTTAPNPMHAAATKRRVRDVRGVRGGAVELSCAVRGAGGGTPTNVGGIGSTGVTAVGPSGRSSLALASFTRRSSVTAS